MNEVIVPSLGFIPLLIPIGLLLAGGGTAAVLIVDDISAAKIADAESKADIAEAESFSDTAEEQVQIRKATARAGILASAAAVAVAIAVTNKNLGVKLLNKF